MATIAVLHKIDGERVADALQDVREKMHESGGELVLEFSSVHQVNPSDLQGLQELATFAETKAARLVLRGVNVEIYKVLKLVKLTSRVSFVN